MECVSGALTCEGTSFPRLSTNGTGPEWACLALVTAFFFTGGESDDSGLASFTNSFGQNSFVNESYIKNLCCSVQKSF